ncbi:MAG: hypothetical protein DRP37_05125 [Thermodesulfobacteriota bacterium]|nr:MAG: hypothetical protein DRP37_05125 [Thermodesulfobacteriota bacterium]
MEDMTGMAGGLMTPEKAAWILSPCRKQTVLIRWCRTLIPVMWVMNLIVNTTPRKRLLPVATTPLGIKTITGIIV